jgi:hypothetical protein
MDGEAKVTSVSVARAVVTRVNGETEVFYSHERVPPWQVVRFLKLHRHLRFMKREDRKAGHG